MLEICLTWKCLCSAVPCQLGFTRVCNSDQTTLTSTALCPKEKEETETEVRCSCLPRRLIEDDLMSGVSPLGLDSKECVQVPADIIYNLKHLDGTDTDTEIFLVA